MKLTPLTTLAAIVVIGLGGFMAGRISSSDASADSRDGTGGATRSSRASAQNDSAVAGGSGRKSPSAERSARAATGSASERLARLEAIVRGENPLDRNRALLAFIDQLGPGDFEAAVAHFRSLGLTDNRFGEYALLLSAWAKIDPLAALDYAKANTGNRFATSTILGAWASADPEAAIRWAETNHEGEGANPHLAGIIRSLAATDPTRATQLLTGMPLSRERGEALDAMMPHLLTRDPGDARSWISALTDDSLREGAMMRAASKLAATDPAGTATWLAANPSQATRTRMDDVYSAWASQDRQAALTSMVSLPSGEIRSNALRGLVSNVATSDPGAALSMMNRFPNDVTDRTVQQYVWHSFGTDPSSAASQIARITDVGRRDETYSRMIGSWLDRDAAAATAWLRSNPLPPKVQAELDKRR